MKSSLSLDSTDAALLQLAIALRERGYRFTTVTPATHERVNNRAGSEWAKSLRDVFGWSRTFREATIPPEIWELMRRADAVVSHNGGWKSVVRLSSLGEQLFLHSAYPTLDAGAVFFGPDTYRFAAALHSHLATSAQAIGRAVDIGCGAGPGAVLVALYAPDAPVLAVDINELALRFTRLNAALNGVANVEARRSDLLRDVEGEFDLIVANPPYLVDPGERAYRHGGGPLGAGLSLAILKSAKERLAPGGTLLLYTGVAIVNGEDPFRAAVAERLAGTEFEWTYREADPDVFGDELANGAYVQSDRIAAVVLTAKKP